MRILISTGFGCGETMEVVSLLRLRYPGSSVYIVRNRREAAFFRGAEGVEGVFEFDLSGFLPALSFARSLLSSRFDIAVFPSVTGTAGIEPKHLFFSLLISARGKYVLSRGSSEPEPFRPGPAMYLRLLWNVSLFVMARAVTSMLCLLPAPGPGRPHAAPSGGRLALYIYRIPDASHHFVYREVVEIKKRLGNDAVLVSHLRGDPAFSTRETRELSDEGILYFPDYKVEASRIWLSYIRAALARPLRTKRVLEFYRAQLGGRLSSFVNPATLTDDFHPIGGFHLAEIMEAEGIGHVHAYGSNMLTNHAMAASLLLGTGFSFTAYVDFDFEYPFRMLREKLEYGRLAVVHTSFCKERLAGYAGGEFADKIVVGRIGLDLERFRYAEGVSDEELKLLSIGNLVEKKGMEYLLKACRVLKDRGVPFTLTIVGDGPLRMRLTGLARELGLDPRREAVFPGALDNETVMGLLAPDKILVQPSVYAADGERDGIPTVLIEAMALGTPVISTEISGIPEAVIDGVTGLLVHERDTEALADAIMRLHWDKDLYARLKARAREKVEAEYDIKVNAALVCGKVLEACNYRVH